MRLQTASLRTVRTLLCALLVSLLFGAHPAWAKDKPKPVHRIFLVGESAEWVDTRVDVRPQDRVAIRAGAEVCFSGGREESCVRAVGWPRASFAGDWPEDAAACEDPFPEWDHAALVAQVGEEIVPIGRQAVLENLEGRLRLSINDCSFEGELRNSGQFSVVVLLENPRAHAARSGRELIEAAIDALGGGAIRGVRSLRARAACTGPGGEFTTEVLTLAPDKTLFKQTSDAGQTEILAEGDRAWTIDRATGRRRKAKKMVRFVRGHEFHDLLLRLDERFTAPTLPMVEEGAVEDAPEAAEACLRVEMLDLYGAPAAVCLDPETSMPVRLSYQPAGRKKDPTIEVELESWREIDGVQFLEAFTLRQGDDVFTYRYDELLPNAVSRDNFRAVSPRALKEIRKRLEENRSTDSSEAPTGS